MARRSDPCVRQHRRVRTPGLTAQLGAGRGPVAVHNLSMGGLCLADAPLPRGSPFAIALPLPGEPSPLVVDVALVRGPEGPCESRCGVRFCGLDADQARRIGAFVAAQAFEPSSPLQRRH